MIKILVYRDADGLLRPRPETEPWDPLPEGVELVGHSMDGCKTIIYLDYRRECWPAMTPAEVTRDVRRSRFWQECAVRDEAYQKEQKRLRELREEKKKRALEKRRASEAESKKKHRQYAVVYRPRYQLCEIEDRWMQALLHSHREEDEPTPEERQRSWDRRDIRDLMRSNSIFRRNRI